MVGKLELRQTKPDYHFISHFYVKLPVRQKLNHSYTGEKIPIKVET